MDVPENMPIATETKNKCFIRKIGVLYVSTTVVFAVQSAKSMLELMIFSFLQAEPN